MLAILYWILLILSLCGLWFPAWPAPARFGPLIVLLIILGLRVFPIALN